MTNKITVPMARASILWLIGEYSDHVPKIAPDVLRQMAKTFCDEEDIVKLQILNLALKLNCTNHKQTQLLVQYVLSLAKYDQNYDIRDRARFLKALSSNNEKCPNLYKHAKKFLLATKPAPVLDSPYKESDHLQLGTLSHAINLRINGYNDLPDFPVVPPDPSVRNVEVPQPVEPTRAGNTTSSGKSSKGNKASSGTKKFYSDEDEEENEQSTDGPDPSDEEGEEDKDESSSESESGSESESSESSTEGDEKSKTKEAKNQKQKQADDSTSSDSEESSSTGSSSESDSESEKKQITKQAPPKTAPQKPQLTTQQPKKVVKKETSDSESQSDTATESSSSSEDEKQKSKQANKPPPKSTAKSSKQQQQQVSLLDLDCKARNYPFSKRNQF